MDSDEKRLYEQIIELQKQHYEDMKAFAVQFGSLSTDLINLNLGRPEQMPQLAEEFEEPEEDVGMLGGSVS